MRAARVSIACLMGLILVVSLALAVLRSNSWIWSGATTLATCALIGLAAVGAACRTGPERAGWLGFAVLGGGYLALVRIAPFVAGFPTARLLEWLGPWVMRGPVQHPYGRFCFAGFGDPYPKPYFEVGHCLISLLLAATGGFAARFLFGTPIAEATLREPATSPTPRSRSSWLFAASIIGGVGALLALCVTFVGLGLRPGAWPALACFLIWALLGLAVIGAVLGQGRNRGIWLGTAVFGIGYCVLMAMGGGETPSWPRSTLDRILGGIRDFIPSARVEFPPVSGASHAANERLRQALDQPITLPFPNETPLEDVLKYIRSTARGPDGRPIPIYIDPLELQGVDKTYVTPITIDLENARLGTSLRLALRQVGLDYMLKDGVLVITSGESVEEVLQTAPQDAFLTVGHCLLAWLAAVLGVALVPLVNRRDSESRRARRHWPETERISVQYL